MATAFPRRRVQLFLAAALCASAIVAAGTSRIIAPGDRERNAIAEVDRLGGSVNGTYGGAPGHPLNSIMGSDVGRPIEDVGLVGRNLRDRDVWFLPDLRGVNALGLGDNPITGRSLETAGRIESLVLLSLYGTDIDDEGLRYLGRLKNLKELHLGRTRITDRGLRYLQQLDLPRLDGINLEHTQITDAAAEILKDFPRLKSVLVGATRFGAVGEARLKSLRPQVYVEIDPRGSSTPGWDLILRRRMGWPDN